ncbi:MAG: Xaa-Pro aminopeptidase [Actinomycetota bacterium]|jgi:Xaa-Pro aminopeptidase|nr:Xaa-Pro aminopeptidase [Actinomycetota bacterium]
MDHEGRVARLQNELTEADMDGLFVTDLTNVRYLTGFSGTNGQVLITRDSATFLTDGRYRARAASLVAGAEIVIYPDRLSDALPSLVEKKGVKRLGIEAANVTLASRDALASAAGGAELVPTTGMVEKLRRVKDADEVQQLESAIAIADAAFEWIQDRLAPGRTEVEIALDLEVQMRQSGADEISFPPIVGSGPLSAHIHHTPSQRALEKGDLVLMDFGARVGGYCSDMTRTVVLGAAGEEQLRIYEIVGRAQQAGIDALGPGVRGVDADAAARKVIDDAGHGDVFEHGLGHGVGLDIHEAPRLARTSEDVLVVGDVVTVEPGVYIGGLGGVRIEDCALITENGARVLGSAPKDRLLEL